MSVETGFVTIKVLENQPVEQGKLPKIKTGSLKVIPKTRLSTEDDSLVISKTETYKIEEGVLVDGDIELPIGNYRFVLTSRASTFKFDSRVGSEHRSSNPLNLALYPPPEQVYPSVNYVKIPSGVSEKQALVVNDGVIGAVDLEIIKGPKGDKGDPATNPNFVVGNITTLPEGSEATVDLVGSDPNYTLNFGIPVGKKGDTGPEHSVRDTGWRDIKDVIRPSSHFPPEAIFTIKRTEDMVFFQVSVLEKASSSILGTSWGIFGGIIPNGFKPRWGASLVLHGRDVTNGHIGITPSGSILWTGQTLDKAYRTHACCMWPTAEPWPETLPGSPV